MVAEEKVKAADAGVLVTGQARTLKSPAEACLYERNLDPCIIVIFGASGDLTGLKLMPALYNLFTTGGLPSPCYIVGCARTSITREQFQEHMAGAVKKDGKDMSRWPEFAALLDYLVLDYGEDADYQKLANFLKEKEEELQTRGNRLFYLAVPPSVYPVISGELGKIGMATEKGRDWVRLVAEKPFGRDLASAQELNRVMLANFKESQIFRIDHYMAKETVQNIIMLRFANAIFEPVWNRNYIDFVGILATETIGVGNRGSFYEETGVLRDMFQSHMMHLLAVTAMEPPSLFEADRVRDEELKVFRSLKPLVPSEFGEYLILGQYGPGKGDGQDAPGYREEPKVPPDSLTPTFGAIRVFVDNWRWQGVPFYLISGKRLKDKLTQIVIQFKEVPHSLFQNVELGRIVANRLILGIYPEEKISLSFETKIPGTAVCLRRVTMEFPYYAKYEGPVIEAYETGILDVIQGDQTLFWREDAVETCWSFFSPIIEGCEQCPTIASHIKTYPAGTWGPAKAWPILAKLVE